MLPQLRRPAGKFIGHLQKQTFRQESVAVGRDCRADSHLYSRTGESFEPERRSTLTGRSRYAPPKDGHFAYITTDPFFANQAMLKVDHAHVAARGASSPLELFRGERECVQPVSKGNSFLQQTNTRVRQQPALPFLRDGTYDFNFVNGDSKTASRPQFIYCQNKDIIRGSVNSRRRVTGAISHRSRRWVVTRSLRLLV